MNALLRAWSAADPVDPDRVGAGTLGFIVFAFLAVATVLILWFMARSIRKVPKDLDVPTHSKRPAPLPRETPADPADGKDA